MSKTGKLGRNPLHHLKKVMNEPPPAVPFSGIEKRETPPSEVSMGAKFKEMQIEVDWMELYRSTLGRQVKKLSRIFSLS